MITVKNKHDVYVNTHLEDVKYLARITSGDKEIIGDEPESLGGADKGFNPYEFLASALSMCTAVTLKAYAERKEIHIGHVDVKVHLTNNTIDKVATFSKQITFENKDLEENDLKRLKAVAESCPVNKLLSNQIIVNTNFDALPESIVE